MNPFSSKYDAYLARKVDLTEQEQRGLRLFQGKAHCDACHPSTPGPQGEPPLFTDFTYDNLGVPLVRPDGLQPRRRSAPAPDGNALTKWMA